MDRKKTLIVTGIVLLIILALIFAAVFYLVRTIQNRQSSSKTLFPTGSSSPAITPSITPTPVSGAQPQPQPQTSGKVYKGSSFQLNYPVTWGVLTCNNSQNFELDPQSSADQPAVLCDRAVKPITVLVTDNLRCTGETVTMGTHQVIRSQDGNKGGAVDYRWCVVTSGVDLDITHRANPAGGPATSKEDFSAQIEQMISTLK
jgi:hypothetical protein